MRLWSHEHRERTTHSSSPTVHYQFLCCYRFASRFLTVGSCVVCSWRRAHFTGILVAFGAVSPGNMAFLAAGAAAEQLRVCVCACVLACVHACVRACVCACVRALRACMGAYVRVCVRACCMRVLGSEMIKKRIRNSCQQTEESGAEPAASDTESTIHPAETV